MDRSRLALLCMLALLLAFSSAAADGGASSVSWADTQDFGIRHGPRDAMRVAVTMDDCNNREHVRALFGLAQEYGVPVTFFPTGSQLLEEDAELWRAIAASPCEIGSHTLNHQELTRLSYSGVSSDIRGSQERLDQVLGWHYGMVSLRPPYGSYRKDGKVMPHILQACLENGYTHMVLWDVSQTDFYTARDQVMNGSILLFHAYKKDVDCLRRLIPWLIDRGYELVTVRELLGLPTIEIGPEPYDHNRDS